MKMPLMRRQRSRLFKDGRLKVDVIEFNIFDCCTSWRGLCNSEFCCMPCDAVSTNRVCAFEY